jgi:hypothetical protein
MADEPDNSKRQRKQVEHYQVERKEKAEFEIPQGKGIKLVEYEHFVAELTKIKSSEELVKCLHQLMYGSPGKKTTVKQNLREFSGFAGEISSDERAQKVIENKKKWTISMLKDALGLFGLEKGGAREDLCKRLVDYLVEPRIIVGAGKGKRPRASSKSSPSKSRKLSKDKKTSKKHAPSAYILFSNARRSQLREENPDMEAKDVVKRLAELWSEASAAEKEEFQVKAAEAKAKLAAEEFEQGVQSDFADEDAEGDAEGERSIEDAEIEDEDEGEVTKEEA